MKKSIKVILIFIGIIIIYLIIDLICIFTLNRPLFMFKTKTPYTYTGIFYNVYNCPEYSIPQIKRKGTKFNCSISNENEEISYVETLETNECDHKPKLYYSGKEYNVYTYCLDSVKINNRELKDYIYSDNNFFNRVIDKLNEKDIVYDGGSRIYDDGGTSKIKSNSITIIKCNTIEGNRDIYIGSKNMKYKSNFCKKDNTTFTKTYKVKKIEENNKTQYENGIEVTYSNSYAVTLEQFQNSFQTVIINNLSYEYELEEGKTYEFEFMLNDDENIKINDNIDWIFKNTSIVEIRETDKKGLEQIQETINNKFND